MATIHEDIEQYLAADLHDELSETERNALHTHLVECADCRKIHQETKNMNHILEENLATAKADGARAVRTGSAVSGAASARRATHRWKGIAPKRIATATANAR